MMRKGGWVAVGSIALWLAACSSEHQFPGGAGGAGGGESSDHAGSGAAAGTSPTSDGGSSSPAAGSSSTGDEAGGGEGGDTQTPPVIQSPGAACDTPAAKGCAGPAQAGKLVCKDGHWTPDGDCAAGSLCDTRAESVGVCAPILTECAGHDPGHTFCKDATTVLACGADLVSADKQKACVDQACIDGVCGGECSPAAGRCTAGGAETCSENGQWGTGVVCVNQACNAGKCGGECVPGTRDCMGNTPRTCSDGGAWLAAAPCDKVCKGGACSGTCVPTKTQCNGQIPQTCDAMGTWQDGSSCTAATKACNPATGLCVGSCVPQAKRCSGNGVQVCSDTGTWGAAAACTNQACVVDTCQGSCAPGALHCGANNSVETCSSAGAWAMPSACATNACINGVCMGVCVPGTKRCNVNNVETCSDQGQWAATQSCVSPQSCSASACKDITAPAVVSITPAAGTKGVASNAKVVVTFSEGMDHASTEAAFSMGTPVTFVWTGNVLTATPNAALVYATSTDKNAPAKSYTVAIGVGAKDVSGNALAAAASSSFSTLRRITLSFSVELRDTYDISNWPSLYVPPYPASDGMSLAQNDGGGMMGDGFGDESDKLFPDFDITNLPSGIVTLENAKFTCNIFTNNPTEGDPWEDPFPSTALGDLVVDHVSVVPLDASAFDVAALDRAGTLMTLATKANGLTSLNVTSSVASDYAQRSARKNHAQFRLQFTKLTNHDQLVNAVTVFPFSTLTLDVTYTIQ
jgi:hypothetical protein